MASDLQALDAVLLDAGGVLVLPDPERMRTAFAPLGAAPDDDKCRFAHYAGMREVDRLGRADWPAVDRVVARSAGVPEERLDEALPSVSRIYLAEDWVPAPGSAAALRLLESTGLEMAIVSNATGRMEQLLLEHRICGLEGEAMAKVRAVIDSHVVGVEKPDPRIFSFALEALEADPDRCVYIGDSVHFDVQGARNAGIRPLHLDPFALCGADDHDHITALDAFAAGLARALA